MRKGFTLIAGCLTFVLLVIAFARAEANENLQITSGPRLEHADSNSAVIAWSTNTNGSTVLKYGTDPNNLNQSAETPWGGLTHRITIQNLQPNTTYYFQASSGQGQGTGTEAKSSVWQFKTTNAPEVPMTHNPTQDSTVVQITNGPNVEYVSGNQAKISWSTNVPSNSAVKYGSDPNLLNQVAQSPTIERNHEITLANLNPNTKYYFEIQLGEGESATTTATSKPYNFQTLQHGQSASATQY